MAIKIDITDLPFVGDRKTLKLPYDRKRQLPRCFWHVVSTGDYSKDDALGRDYALRYLDYEAADRGGPGHLQLIVGDMPRNLGPIEIGFPTLVSYAAAAGRAEAHRVERYWRSCAETEALEG